MRKFSWMISAAAMALGASQAYAQDADGDASAESDNTRNTIFVTAQKREEDIQDVPLSIVAFNGDALADANITDPTQLGQIAPALQISRSINSGGVGIRIRGFGSAGNSVVDPDVATYVDGTYVPRPGALVRSFLDVSTVEVLSGPQGTLFGRNAVMGAISIRTNEPVIGDTEASFDLEAARYDTYSAAGMVNLPVGDTFAIRVAGRYDTTDGYFFNQLDGQTYGESEDFIGRISTNWEITPELTWVVRADYSETDGDGVYPLTVYTETAPANLLAAYDAFAARANGVSPVLPGGPSFTVNQRISPGVFNTGNQWGLTSTLTYEVSPVADLRLINSYRDWENQQLFGDTFGTSYDMLMVGNDNFSKIQSHELQFISTEDAYLDERLGITAGIYYAREEYQLHTSFNFGTQFCDVLFSAPIPFVQQLRAGCNAAPRENAGIRQFNQVSKTFAIYGQADYALTPTLSLGLGARYTNDEKDAISSQTLNNPGAFRIVGNEGPTALPFSDDNVSVRASLSWEATDDILLFGTFSTGYKAGGFNEPTPENVAIADRRFESTTVEDYQIGMKSILLDGAMRLNITAFQTDLHDFQDRSFDGTFFRIRNSGDVRSRGVDLDGDVSFNDNIRFVFAGTVLDAEYTDNVAAPGLEGCEGSPTCPLVQDLSGTRLPYAPELKGRIGLELNSGPFGDGYEVTFGAYQNHTSSFLTANTGNPQSRVDGYDTTDLRLTLVSPDDRWSLTVFGNNVFGEVYYTATVSQALGSLFGATDPATGQTVFRGFLGEPSRYGVRLSANF